MAILTLTVTDAQSGRTVHTLLKSEFGLSNGCVNRLKRTDTGLTLNGTRVFTNVPVRSGDVLSVDLDAGERPVTVTPVPMDLDIVFEDEHLLILNKGAPMSVIPSSLVPGEPTLANGLAHYFGSKFSFHPVNRLDRGTTGLMIIAKSGHIHDQLQRNLHSGDFYRRYLAVCVGCPQPASGSIHAPIGRAPDSAIKRQIAPDGQSAHSAYQTLGHHGPFSLVELTPLTGRTHQLRVHMASIGCPLAGDWLYGTEDRSLIARPALHASQLAVAHPITGEHLTFTAPMPADMIRLMEL